MSEIILRVTPEDISTMIRVNQNQIDALVSLNQRIAEQADKQTMPIEKVIEDKPVKKGR